LDGGGVGTTWEFVLNEAADSVTVLRDGGNPQNLGALGPGRHNFSMGGFSTFDIQVSDSAAEGWTSISDPSNLFDDFNIPSGVAVNTDPSNLARFGSLYVAQAATTPTKSGRAQGDGIYYLTADMKGADAATFAAVADPNDTTQAKGSAFFGVAGSTTSSPWRLSFDDSNNLIVADWSDPAGGVKYMNPSLTAGARILGGVGFDGSPRPDLAAGATCDAANCTGPGGGVYSEEQDEFGRIPLHGSSGAKVYATGSVGVDLTIYVMDEDLDKDLAWPNNDTNHIWRHDVGAQTEYDDLAPTLVVDSTSIPTNSDGSVNLIGIFGPGVATGMHYDEGFGHWYVNQPRSNGDTSAGVAIVDAALDGSNASNPTLLWSSIQFTIDNGLDGDTTLPDPNNDIFRRVREVAISPDGQYLVLHKNGADSCGGVEVCGIGDGAVYLVPLDENGIPDIEVVDGKITNVINIETLGDNGAHNSGAQVEFDAAGNLYVANSSVSTASADPLLTGQLVQVFSPGGNWLASTKSDGTFDLTPLAAGPTGDFNGDGFVDAADYVAARKLGTQADLDAFFANFGETVPGSGGAVPEPAAAMLVAIGMLVVGGCRRRVSSSQEQC
jgi:hypothetical protein